MSDIRRYLSIAKMLMALALVVFLVISIGVENIISTFASVNPKYVTLVVSCLTLLLFIGAFNVWVILKSIYPVPFRSFLKVYFYSWTISLITPGQAGDASLILLLKKDNIPMRDTGTAYIVDKIITLGFFFFIAWYGSYNFIPELKDIWIPVLSAGFILLIFTFLIIKFFPVKTPLTNKSKKLFDAIIIKSKILKKKWYILVVNVMLTLMKWLVLSLCYMVAFLAFDVYVEWPEIGIIPILSTLVGYIPISIGGIGTVELTATHLFSKVGVEESVVLSAYLLLRSMQYIMAIILLIFFSSKKSDYKVKLNTAPSSSRNE